MILVNLTNGFGNNLFQYNAAKLLAEFHNTTISAIPPTENYYAKPDLEKLGLNFVKASKNYSSLVLVNEGNYSSLFNDRYGDFNFLVRGYYEDYTFFEKDIQRIKDWYPKAKKRNDKDLVIHFRAGDRLFYKNEFDSKPSVNSYIQAINKFDFERLHIVTDMPSWSHITRDSLAKMSFHYKVPEKDRVDPQRSVDYFNSFIDGFAKYSPIVKKRSIIDDFNFIRTFDNILFQHGTMGWWAAALSNASKVGVYGPWRPWKGTSNKNLSKVPFKGWFQWQ